ncbi:aminotransferase class III-fold pyridoxal phosphate-dependent enzyme [Halomarina oriensis]|uniref:Glutamate-1-semialdehyde 2,1-aminomutase n=1 Tax=Halomarina oriensis TaxID=671145 RepID=A0A6B0GQR2_9EURY|nr:aminotransferase class III-fold pyridoxal phosphate-dependent enzyme [Halomarina oriensis]MWG35003.1 aminotransferase class III-fold pyridoxal phosphate-dependent enzyme [Halomarina oriensis]
MSQDSTGSVDTDRSLDRSRALLDRARQVIPGAAQTNSKGPTRWVQGVAPTHLERGQGSHVWDVDGNEYIDHVSSLGPIVLGHDYPAVTEAVEAQVGDGSLFSLPHPLQVEVAERIVDVVPCAEMVRFAKNGNDVTTAAAKLARAHTGRDVVATQGYHGWGDVWMAATAMDAGIPAAVGGLTEPFDYNDIERVEAIFDDHPDDVAAVVTTPVNLDPPEDEFLTRLRELCDEHDALLVYDEVLTGFRFALGGAGEFFGVQPDLACFAKAMANGYPLAALAGRADVMRTIDGEGFFFSSTYAGDAVSLAAANATLSVLREVPVVEHLHEQGEALRDGYTERAAAHGLGKVTTARGYAPRSAVSFESAGGASARHCKSLFLQECLDRGVLFAGTHLPNYSHTDADVARTLTVYDEALGVLAAAIEDGAVTDRLRGEPVGATLRERTGEAGGDR